MKILLKYLISNIKNNLLRSFLIVFSILLASSIFYVNINIYDDVIDNANSLIEGTTKGYDLLITDYDSSVVLPECEDILNIQREEGKYKVTEEIALPISCNIVNIEELVGSNLISLSDSKIYNYSINDAIISKAKAKYYNINIGDEFTVLINDTETKVIIKDIIDSFGIFTESNLDKIELFINRKVINDNAKILKLKDDLKIESYYNSLKDINVNVEYLSKQGSGQNDANNIKKVMYVVLIFVMILSFYVISTTTKLLINYRLQVLGTFRSVGASKRQIRILLILENLIYGLVGALLGIICGDVIRRFIRSSIFDLPYIQIDYKKALYVLVFSILFDLLITIVSIFKASRKSIINLIFVKQSSYYKYPIVLGILGLLIFLSSFYISNINIELNFNYLVIELLTAIIGMSLMCGLICRIIGSLLSFITKKINGEMWLGIKNQANSSINIGNTILLTIIVSLMLTVYVLSLIHI